MMTLRCESKCEKVGETVVCPGYRASEILAGGHFCHSYDRILTSKVDWLPSLGPLTRSASSFIKYIPAFCNETAYCGNTI